MSQQTADLLIVARMRDEASQQMERLGDTVSRTEFEALQAQAAFTAFGSALTAVGSLLNQIDDPAAKMAANFISSVFLFLKLRQGECFFWPLWWLPACKSICKIHTCSFTLFLR